MTLIGFEKSIGHFSPMAEFCMYFFRKEVHEDCPDGEYYPLYSCPDFQCYYSRAMMDKYLRSLWTAEASDRADRDLKDYQSIYLSLLEYGDVFKFAGKKAVYRFRGFDQNWNLFSCWHLQSEKEVLLEDSVIIHLHF